MPDAQPLSLRDIPATGQSKMFLSQPSPTASLQGTGPDADFRLSPELVRALAMINTASLLVACYAAYFTDEVSRRDTVISTHESLSGLTAHHATGAE